MIKVKVIIIKFKDLKEEHKKRFREQWDKNPKNYDEKLDDNQMILIPLTELKDLINA